ncbi:retrotransposon hot spot (RHS) protein, putative [Trypanosoma cruzi]|nr:retrotransposon hot spot (RHS) protein, putative [Trypanosoma cruzi]
MEAFLLRPTMFINDNEILGLITALPSYQALEAINKLRHEGVFFLEQWRGFRRKNTVALLARGKINAALPRAQTSTPVVNSKVLKGCYEPVYIARCHHVVEVPGGEGTVMEVKEGEPEQSWTYNEVGKTFEKDDAVQQSGKAPPRLMVLTSDKGWPYKWGQGLNEFIPDCYVNCEVERVWRIVKRDLTEWFSSYGKNKPSSNKHVLIGTPGIGKSMAAGSYLLYQLLHYDAEQLPMVAYVITDRKFLFDKITRTVKKYSAASNIVDIFGRVFLGVG